MSVSIIANKQYILTLHSIIDNKEETGIDINNIQDQIVCFDDGLFSQLDLIKELNKTKKVYFFPSGFLIRTGSSVLIKNSLAHKELENLLETDSEKYFRKESKYFNTFLNLNEIEELIQKGVNFGIHGWYHLNLNIDQIKNIESRFKKRIIAVLREDASLSWNFYKYLINKYPNEFYSNGSLNLNYCTPFNVWNEYQKIWVELFKGYILKDPISKNKNVNLNIFSYERNKKCHYVKHLE